MLTPTTCASSPRCTIAASNPIGTPEVQADRMRPVASQRMLRRRSPRAGVSWTMLIFVLIVLGAGAGATWYYLKPEETNQATPFEYVVRRATFVYETSERGELESSRNVEVRCQVKGSSTAILELIPEGTFVQKGDVLAKLDDSALQAQLQQQQIVCNTSQAAVTQARNVYETALIARLEYLEGTFKQEEQLILNEMLVAEENLRRAMQFAKYSRRLASKGYLSPLQLDADEFAVDKARNEMETAQTKLRVLRDFNKEKMLKQLESDIKIAKANYDSALKTYELDLAKLEDIKEQLASCVVRAPTSGEVVYANDRSRRSDEPDIIEGALVRERQVMFRLPDTRYMQVKTKVNESRVALVKDGMPAKIRLDSSWGQELEGRVVRVDSYPIPTRWSASSVKDYACYVEVLNPPDNVRPGLAAQVTILLEQQPDALLVPVQAVYPHGKQHYCVVSANGRREVRRVEIGSSNEKFVVIRNGISEGEVVLQNPDKFINIRDLPDVRRDEALVDNRWGTLPGSDGQMVSPASSPGASRPPAVADRPRGGFPGGENAGGQRGAPERFSADRARAGNNAQAQNGEAPMAVERTRPEGRVGNNETGG